MTSTCLSVSLLHPNALKEEVSGRALSTRLAPSESAAPLAGLLKVIGRQTLCRSSGAASVHPQLVGCGPVGRAVSASVCVLQGLGSPRLLHGPLGSTSTVSPLLSQTLRLGHCNPLTNLISLPLSFSFLALTVISSLVPLLYPQAFLPSPLHLLAVCLFWFSKHLLSIYCVPKHYSDPGQQRCVSEDTLPGSPSSGFFPCHSQLSWVGQACVGSRLEGETASCQPWPRSLLPSSLSQGLSPITFSVTLGPLQQGRQLSF